MRVCRYSYLGQVDYEKAWELQKHLVAERQAGRIEDTLLLLEHSHVYTIGRRGVREHVLLNDAGLLTLGVPIQYVDRGGEVTYHGPGQLVGYPIIQLKPWGGPLRYVRALEDVLVRTLHVMGIEARQIPGLTGVWVGDAKIASIGVRVSRGVTSHGFALNVSTDLSYFRHIVPCGIPCLSVTSIEEQLGNRMPVSHVYRGIAEKFGQVLEFAMQEIPEAEVLRVATVGE